MFGWVFFFAGEINDEFPSFVCVCIFLCKQYPPTSGGLALN